MSEPASLYARLTLSPAAHAALLASTPTPPAAYDDWQPWLAGQQMTGAPLPATILQSRTPAADSVGALMAQ